MDKQLEELSARHDRVLAGHAIHMRTSKVMTVAILISFSAMAVMWAFAQSSASVPTSCGSLCSASPWVGGILIAIIGLFLGLTMKQQVRARDAHRKGMAILAQVRKQSTNPNGGV